VDERAEDKPTEKHIELVACCTGLHGTAHGRRARLCCAPQGAFRN
jgi:hypothetical protein